MTKFPNESYSTFAFRLTLPFNSWVNGEEAFENVESVRKLVKLEQFVDCMPTKLHRWVTEKRPKIFVDAAKLADEYAILYKPFKFDEASENKTFPAKTDKYGGCENSQQHFKAKGVITKPVIQNWTAPDVLCIRCDQGGHTASVCRSKWSNTHKLLEPEPHTAGTTSKFEFRTGWSEGIYISSSNRFDIPRVMKQQLHK